MKRLLFIMLAFFALSCGDGSNRQSEAEDRDEIETETMEGGDLNTDETQQSDTTQMNRDTDVESDTTGADGSRRQ